MEVISLDIEVDVSSEDEVRVDKSLLKSIGQTSIMS